MEGRGFPRRMTPADPHAGIAPREPGARPPSRLRRLLTLLTLLYAAGLLLLLTLLEYWGEHLGVFSLLLYAPPPILLLPLAILTPACLLLRPRLCLWHLACIAILLFGYMTFGWHSPPAPRSGELKVMTFNTGQSDRRQFPGLVETERPDIIALQDARGRGIQWAKKHPGDYVKSLGEFVLISRHPIRQSQLLDQPRWHGRPVAARYEIDFHGRIVVLYSVHLPTPRPVLSRFLSGRAVIALLGEDDDAGETTGYRGWITERIALARALADVFAREPEPFIACGDFNMPDHGIIHDTFASRFTDAFDATGRGWGLTFPGGKRSLVTRLGPWLRLDYFFTRGWHPIACAPESGHASQHRAVLARFRGGEAGK